MSAYRIFFQTTTEVSVEVEADDLDAAIDEAYASLPGGVCHQCSGYQQMWSRDEGDLEVVERYHEVDGEFVEVES